VRDAHGKTVARRRFENALTTNGARILAQVVGGAGTAGVVGGQGVRLDEAATGNACTLLNVNVCTLYYVYHPGAQSLANTGSGGASFTLSGHVTPLATTTFTKVETLVKTCTGYTSAVDCADDEGALSGWQSFTSKTLASPLTVQAGQSVGVTVQLSFS
jgi:hypothetical protein